MSAKSDRHEKIIAEEIDKINGIVATRPPASVHYSDVKVKKGNSTAWVEVKMNITDNIINTRFYYEDGEWLSSNSGNGTKALLELANKSNELKNFIDQISSFSNIAKDKIIIPTTKSGLRKENAVPYTTIKSFFSTKPTAYILPKKNIDVSDIAKKHYSSGKTESAEYIQIGDNFFRLSSTDDPLSLGKKIHILNSMGEFGVRVSIRSSSSAFYEIQPEVKFTKIGFKESEYSFLPNTKKLNPFFAL